MLLLFQLVQAYVVFIKLKVFGRQKGGQNSREKSFSSVDVFKTSGKVNMILNDYQCRRQTPPRIKISNESERIWNVSQWTKVLLNAIWYFTQSGTFTCTRLTFKKNYKLFTVDVRFTLISFYNLNVIYTIYVKVLLFYTVPKYIFIDTKGLKEGVNLMQPPPPLENIRFHTNH